MFTLARAEEKFKNEQCDQRAEEAEDAEDVVDDEEKEDAEDVENAEDVEEAINAKEKEPQLIPDVAADPTIDCTKYQVPGGRGSLLQAERGEEKVV